MRTMSSKYIFIDNMYIYIYIYTYYSCVCALSREEYLSIIYIYIMTCRFHEYTPTEIIHKQLITTHPTAINLAILLGSNLKPHPSAEARTEEFRDSLRTCITQIKTCQDSQKDRKVVPECQRCFLPIHPRCPHCSIYFWSCSKRI